VAHACNPSQAGGRDKFPKTLSQKTFHKNRVGRVAQGEGPEFKSQYQKKKKKKITQTSLETLPEVMLYNIYNK
jgi:hypothetical protein